MSDDEKKRQIAIGVGVGCVLVVGAIGYYLYTRQPKQFDKNDDDDKKQIEPNDDQPQQISYDNAEEITDFNQKSSAKPDSNDYESKSFENNANGDHNTHNIQDKAIGNDPKPSASNDIDTQNKHQSDNKQQIQPQLQPQSQSISQQNDNQNNDQNMHANDEQIDDPQSSTSLTSIQAQSSNDDNDKNKEESPVMVQDPVHEEPTKIEKVSDSEPEPEPVIQVPVEPDLIKVNPSTDTQIATIVKVNMDPQPDPSTDPIIKVDPSTLKVNTDQPPNPSTDPIIKVDPSTDTQIDPIGKINIDPPANPPQADTQTDPIAVKDSSTNQPAPADTNIASDQKDEEETEPIADNKQKQKLIADIVNDKDKDNDKDQVVQSGILIVKVVSAKSMNNKPGSKSWCDGMVELQCPNNDNKQTKTVKNRKHPKWNQTFEFNIKDPMNDILTATLYDFEQYASNKSIGESVKIKINDIISSDNTLRKSYKIVGSTNSTTLRLELFFEPKPYK